MAKLRDLDLPRRYPDVRVHKHPVGAEDHELCSAPAGWVPERHVFRVMCVTEGCRAANRFSHVPANINADGIVRIVCGYCGEWIESYEDLGEV